MHRDKNGEKYEVDAFRVGLCNKEDEWVNCKGGCNDYQAGGYCGNGNIYDKGNGNSGARCEKYYGAKIAVECLDGIENRAVSCYGGIVKPQFSCLLLKFKISIKKLLSL